MVECNIKFIRFELIKLFYKLKTIKMKKKVLLIAALFTAGLSFAQDGLTSKKGVPILPEAGDWSIGFDASNLLQFGGNMLNGNTSNTLSSFGSQNAGMISGKKIIDANKAYRVMGNLGFGTSTTSPDTNNTISTSGFDLGIGLGIENRRGKGRLQGVYGPMASISFGTGSTETETTVASTVSTLTVTPGAKIALGVSYFAGVEYFFAPKMSLGAEVSYGLSLNIVGESETESKTSAATTTTKADGSTSINLGQTPNTMISLNFYF